MLKDKGFSLLELLLVIAIAAGIFAFSAPFSMNFYRTQLINDVQSNLIDALQRARHNAILQKNDSNFGVHIVSGSYTLFQTPDLTYASHVSDQDEVFPVINNIAFSGLTDIIFSKLTGVPSISGTIAMSYDVLTRGIAVGSSGVISKDDSVVFVGGSSGCVATGGTISTTTGYVIHTFKNTGSSTFTVTSGSCHAEVLVVAGGGGGGSAEGNYRADSGGGGGAGGLIYNNSFSISANSYTVVVGSGGLGSHTYAVKGTSGSNSSFAGLVAIGGGGGGSDDNATGLNGGSGGGAGSVYIVGNVGGDADYISPRQGYDGGNTSAGAVYDRGGAGGGGSGGPGGSRISGFAGGLGGVGTTLSISGISTTYATGGSGGTGDRNLAGAKGSDYTGNGGGGSDGDVVMTGGDGGSGIVIIRYPAN